MLQAFLQRIVNGGGHLERECGLGRGRTDLLVLWSDGKHGDPTSVSKHVIECKVVRPGQGRESVILAGIEQTGQYMDKRGAESGHLVIFDMRPDRPWDQRLFRRDPDGTHHDVTVWGM